MSQIQSYGLLEVDPVESEVAQQIVSQSLKALTSHVIYNWGYTSNASYTCRQLLNTGLSVTSLGEVKMPFPWCTDTQEEGLC